MLENAKAMVLASFAADSLALGVHWIYDTSLIDKRFGRVAHLLKPAKESYHPTKGRGEFTHYGDQALNLLDSLAASAGFNLDHFAQSWRDFFKTYPGYMDQATRSALQNFIDGKDPRESGSASADLGGAARISPLVYLYRNDLNALVGACRAQTAMTHNNRDVIDSADFFARTTWKVLRNTSPVAALKSVVAENFDRAPFNQWVSAGLASAGRETRAAIAEFGQMCDIAAAFPAVVHLLARYEDNLAEALVENVMAGGDSAARGMLTGMVLGAYLGMKAIPDDWLADLKSRETIVRALAKIDPDDN